MVSSFLGIVLSIVLIMLGSIWLLTLAACCLVVIQDTSNGHDRVQTWPGAAITEWMWDTFAFLNSVLVSFLPAMLLSSLSVWLAVPAALAGAAIFPFFLLSTLDAGSPLALYSRAVWRTWQAALPLWQRFYVQAAGLILIGGLGLGGMLGGGFILRAAGSAVLVGSLLVYSRLLGTHARRLAELGQPEEDEPDEP